jgi:hypothetical protein
MAAIFQPQPKLHEMCKTHCALLHGLLELETVLKNLKPTVSASEMVEEMGFLVISKFSRYLSIS